MILNGIPHTLRRVPMTSSSARPVIGAMNQLHSTPSRGRRRLMTA